MARHFLVNVYLVEGDDSLTLVDTGYGLAAAGIFDQAKRLGKPINRIALTHGHRDHAGGVDKMKAARPGLELVCSERD
ncbi:MAG: MBL fold metallo-hydrolase [Micrococcales bacterium]|nr:MBL fold metallo-hydrolase [Micrococcales bacterium]